MRGPTSRWACATSASARTCTSSTTGCRSAPERWRSSSTTLAEPAASSPSPPRPRLASPDPGPARGCRAGLLPGSHGDPEPADVLDAVLLTPEHKEDRPLRLHRHLRESELQLGELVARVRLAGHPRRGTVPQRCGLQVHPPVSVELRRRRPESRLVVSSVGGQDPPV